MIFATTTAKTKQKGNLILFATNMTRKTWQNDFPHFNEIFPNKDLTTQSWIYWINWIVIMFVSSYTIHFVSTIQHQQVTRITVFQSPMVCPHVGSHLNDKNISKYWSPQEVPSQLMVGLYMCFQIALLGKILVTNSAYKWFFSSMSSHVHCKMGFRLEKFSTNQALRSRWPQITWSLYVW